MNLTDDLTDDLADDLAALPTLSMAQLRRRYAELFGEASHATNKTWLIRRLAWRLQALALGDLSQRARDRAAQLANDADLRLSPPKRPLSPPTTPIAAEPTTAAPGRAATPQDPRLPPPGSVISRIYKGQQLHVTVLASGFAFHGQVFPSLSALAKAITGSHCNGFHFFRLAKSPTTTTEVRS
jgi:Protein of unknown function (DUF2924)